MSRQGSRLARIYEEDPGFDVTPNQLVSWRAQSDHEREMQDLRAENDRLRNMLAVGDGDCIYCGLPKADMAKCAHGFPGCARADDLLAQPQLCKICWASGGCRHTNLTSEPQQSADAPKKSEDFKNGILMQ